VDTEELTRLVAIVRAAGTDTPRIEVKAAFGGMPKSVRETLSAFSNGSGGVLILGLDEATGFQPSPGFRPIPMRDALAGVCADDMQPPIRAEIEIMAFEGASLVVAEIPEIGTAARPCYIKGRGEFQGSFIRGGDGDRKLTEYEVSLLHANRGQPCDDLEPVARATPADLDEDAVAALLRRVRTRQPGAFRGVPDEVALQRLGVLVPSPDPGSDRLVPTLGGLLALGVYPQQFFPQLNVTFVVLPSENVGVIPAGGPRFIDNRSLNGPIPVMVVDAVDAIVRNMQVGATIRGLGREDVYEYPVETLREAVINALMHRDYGIYARGAQVQIEMYPDHLCVRNPGGLFGAVNEDELGADGISSSRNSVLSALLQEVTLPGHDRVVCENRGTGIPAMLGQLLQAGTASVSFHNAISHFTAVFKREVVWHGRESAAVPTARTYPVARRAADILALFGEGRELKATDVMNATGLGRAMTLRYLSNLVADGYLEATAPKGSRQRTYRYLPAGADT
jgi:ATP-dependent DNA helicase RecG